MVDCENIIDKLDLIRLIGFFKLFEFSGYLSGILVLVWLFIYGCVILLISIGIVFLCVDGNWILVVVCFLGV